MLHSGVFYFPETVDAKCLFQFAQQHNFSAEDEESGLGQSKDLPCRCRNINVVKHRYTKLLIY